MKNAPYHVELTKGVYLGPVQFDHFNRMKFKHVTDLKQAYSFWTRKFACEVQKLIRDKFPNNKVI